MKLNFLFAALLVSLCHNMFAQSNCALKLERDSIKVYTCDIGNSKFKAVKSTFFLKSNFSQLAAAVLDIENYGEWQYKTAEAKVLKRISDREIIYYTEIAAPALTSNRDLVIQLTVDQDFRTGELIVDAATVPGYVPFKEGVVRVPYSKARWIARQLGPDLLQVEYSLELDLGGSVPPWIVNWIAPIGPYETFRDLKAKIGNYKNSTVSFTGE